jgi:hypothetical protein
MEQRADLDVVIVSATGSGDLLRACLGSLRAAPLTSGRMRVHVVDNASEDDTPDVVAREFPEVRLHRLDRNYGFAKANNHVLRTAGARHQLLLNPDTEVYAGVLDHMVAVMDRDPRIGVAGCRLVRRDGTFDHAAKRSFPTPVGALAHFTGLNRVAPVNRRLAQYLAPEVDEHGVGEVDAVNGAFMLIRHEALRDVGLLDEWYWMGQDDLDWCLRCKRAGWTVWYDGTVTALHVKGATSKRRGHRGLAVNVAFHRSMGHFYRKFHGGRRPLVDLAVYTGILVKLAVAVTRSTIARRQLR